MRSCMAGLRRVRRSPRVGILFILSVAAQPDLAFGSRAITAEPTTQSSAVITWTAVGDDGHSGTAAQYDFRYATVMITEENWQVIAEMAGEPPPRAAGEPESLTIEGLLPGTTYYFALKVGDEVPNWSGLSNVAVVTTPAAPPQLELHVAGINVSRKTAGPNVWGLCDVCIRDGSDLPVRDALVFIAATGPTNEVYSAATGDDGWVAFQSSKVRDPGGSWCFEVTDVAHPTHGYDPEANLITLACEGGMQQPGLDMPAGDLRFANRDAGLLPSSHSLPVSFRLERPGHVRVTLYDVQGKTVCRLADERRPAGIHTLSFDLNTVASGVYFCRLETEDHRTARRLLVVK